jgi:hypothetical protein
MDRPNGLLSIIGSRITRRSNGPPPANFSKNLPKPAKTCHFRLRNRYDCYNRICSWSAILAVNRRKNQTGRAGEATPGEPAAIVLRFTSGCTRLHVMQ